MGSKGVRRRTAAGKSRTQKPKNAKRSPSIDTRKASAAKGKNGSSAKGKRTGSRTAAVSRRRTGARRSGGSRRSSSLRHSTLIALRFSAYWSAVAACWAALLFAGVFTYYSLTMGDPHLVGHTKKGPNIKIVGADGSVLSDRGRRWSHVYLEDLPPYVVDAVLSTEDRRFYSHFGVDLRGLGRAMATNFQAGRVVQGGSTITQQLAKNLYLSPERTFVRKGQEILIAMWLETAMTKDEILELYLNRVYFGAGAYGIGEASWLYFGKRAEKLTLAEATILAGLLKAPSRYAPTHNAEGARARADEVIDNMVESGKITLARARQAKKTPMHLTNAIRHARGYDYALDFVRDEVVRLTGAVKSDLVVETTIDPQLQLLSQNAVESVMAGASEMVEARQASAVFMARDGSVRALVGGRSYKASQFNRAVDAKRQPGSTFKPFVYLTALEAGFKPDTLVEDRPLKIGNWRPRNASGKFYGTMTLREALARSVNTISVRLLLNVGSSRVVETAKRLGISSHLRRDASLALGTSEVSLLELTSAFVPFANGGFSAKPFVVKSVRTADGKLLYRRKEAQRVRVMSPALADDMGNMLRAAVSWGTGKSANFGGQPIAGKTGTSQGFRDAWFIGFTPQITGGVWIGNDDGSPMRSVSGGGLPAKIWRKILLEAYKKGSPVANTAGVVRRKSAAFRKKQPDDREMINQLAGTIY